ncbi:MAG: transposase [Deltaproteobacteria bacterium]|nr:transposase [Deltaproteobacteria bacterium]
MTRIKQRRSLRVGAGQGAGPKGQPERQEIRLDELKEILERARAAGLSADDVGKLEGAVDTLAFLTSELEAKGASLKRLRQMLFGASTEKTSNLFGDAAGDEPGNPAVVGEAAAPTAAGEVTDPAATQQEPASETTTKGEAAGEQPKQKPKGHGRNGAASYTGAERISVPHGELTHGASCPFCQKGKVYEQKEPAQLLRVFGMPPLSAKVWELQRLRCNLCGEVVTAQPPEGVGDKKYDESASSMVGLLRYGTGTPFERLEHLQGNLGVPLPASTQWELVAKAADLVEPAGEELLRQAAQGELMHNDDTNAKILELLAEQQPKPEDSPDEESGQKSGERTGLFTTGIVSLVQSHLIALFFTGRQHAGENIRDVLAQRAAELPPPIQMCDALSRNTVGDFETIVANCITHYPERRIMRSRSCSFPPFVDRRPVDSA